MMNIQNLESEIQHLRDALTQQQQQPETSVAASPQQHEQQLAFERGLIRQMESDLQAKDERVRQLESELDALRTRDEDERSRKSSSDAAINQGNIASLLFSIETELHMYECFQSCLKSSIRPRRPS